MMNLNEIAGSAIQGVSPDIEGMIYRSSGGYATSASGKRTPAYAAGEPVSLQVQGDLTAPEIQKIQGLNLQGQLTAIYLNGNWKGLIRADQTGGDRITFNGQTWQVVHILEDWQDWTKVVAARQS